MIKHAKKCIEGEIQSEQHTCMVLKCLTYRVERNRMLGKVRRFMKGTEI